MDTSAPKPGDVILTESSEYLSAPPLKVSFRPLEISADFLLDLWRKADGEACDLTLDEFINVVAVIGGKHNYGLPPGLAASAREIEAFLNSLHLTELALAHACAHGRERAWERFFDQYRAFLTQTAIAITASSSLGHDLSDSLYAELYGLRGFEGNRRSPLASYSGRGSLQGWLRTTIVQRWRDHHRRTHREAPLNEIDCAAPDTSDPDSVEPGVVGQALSKTLGELPLEDRFLLSAYFLDRQTLLQIARTINVHEGTVSRRLTRLLNEIRRQLLASLQQHGGLSKRAALEALGTDPRDLEINLRALLQSSQLAPFSNRGESAASPDTP